ncbi:Transmembrane osmosensor [Phlyctochytrium bullatum]|nr:Transmembrane osmosensor [Phlyctochytrium bullatum]
MGTRHSPNMQIGYLTNNLVLLGLLGLYFLGWFLKFVGACVLASNYIYDQVVWFFVCYHLALVFVLVGAVVYNAVRPHRILINGFLMAGFVWVVMSLDVSAPGAKASGPALILAANIFLCFAYLPLIVIFSVDESSPIHGLCPVSFPDDGSAPAPAGFSFPALNFSKSQTAAQNSPAQPIGMVPVPVPAPAPMPAPMTSSIPYPAAPVPAPVQMPPAAQYEQAPPAAAAPSYPVPAATIASAPAPAAAQIPSAASLPPAATAPFVCKAKALYSYTANPEDPKEISFSKGDVLEIIDNKGKWWHARRFNPDGTSIVGIAPSNYLQVI